MPLNEILVNRTTKQPIILAVGPNKGAIEEYFIILDNEILPSEENDIVSTLDLLFKIHFVFNLQFETNLKGFFQFLEFFFYNLESNIIITPRMREIKIKLTNNTSM